MGTKEIEAAPPSLPRAWWTAALLTLGYTAYYFCRTNFSVARPLQIAELAGNGYTAELATILLGRVATFGVVFGILGKFFAGTMVARLGGPVCFLLGMLGAVLATALFALSPTVFGFGVAWSLNRLFQALGWPAAIRLIGSWFPPRVYGRAMGLMSLSWLFGDALARAGQAQLVANGLGWRAVYGASAAVLGVVAVLCALFVREGTATKASAIQSAPSMSPKELLRLPGFWLVSTATFAYTLVNVTLSEWLPVYFHETLKLSTAVSGRASALYPLLGGISAVAFGAAADRLGLRKKYALLLWGLLGTALGLIGFAVTNGVSAGMALVALVGLVTGGPYAYAVGAAALDLAGRNGAATANGLIDGTGYLGAILAGEAVARVAVKIGWGATFATLAGVCVVTAAVCALGILPKLQSKERTTTE